MRKESELKLNYLLIGPLPNGKSSAIGGTTVSFQTLVEFFERHHYNYNIVVTNKFSGTGKKVMNVLYIIGKTFLFLFKSQVILFNSNPKAAVYLSPVIFSLSRLFGRKFIVRVFGGNLIEYYEQSSSMNKFMLKSFFFKADLILLQTKRLINYFQFASTKIDWYPTARKKHNTDFKNRNYTKRFVYVGQVVNKKGIDLLILLRKRLDPDYIIDIYGPILDKSFEFLKNESFYKGVLKPEEVSNTLNQYDVLLLPTFHPGEGYPGVIIEANQLAIPVISTRWLGIPELVIQNETGILIEPGSFDDLYHEIVSMNYEKYQLLSQRAYEWSNQFDSEHVNTQLIEKIQKL